MRDNFWEKDSFCPCVALDMWSPLCEDRCWFWSILVTPAKHRSLNMAAIEKRGSDTDFRHEFFATKNVFEIGTASCLRIASFRLRKEGEAVKFVPLIYSLV